MAYKIPRDSLIEANQSGLIAETLIDITPHLPITPSKVRGGTRPLSRQVLGAASIPSCI